MPYSTRVGETRTVSTSTLIVRRSTGSPTPAYRTKGSGTGVVPVTWQPSVDHGADAEEDQAHQTHTEQVPPSWPGHRKSSSGRSSGSGATSRVTCADGSGSNQPTVEASSALARNLCSSSDTVTDAGAAPSSIS